MHPGKILLLFLTIPAFARGQFTVQNGAAIYTTGNATIGLQDIDLIIDGSIVQFPGDGIWTFTGSGNNTISGAATPIIDKLQIAKTGSASILLLQNIDITGGVYFSSGLIDLNNNHITLQPAANLYFENDISHTTATNGGYIETNTNLNAPAAANPGNLGATITSSQNLGATIIRRGHYSQTNSFGGGNSIVRYYDILPTNDIALNATLRINYLNSELNGLDPSTLVLWKSTDTLHWNSIGYTTRDASANYVEATGISDLSRWTLSSLINPLPVKITSFKVACANGQTHITWTTAQEQNSSRFDVQTSTDGAQWQTIAQLPAAGNSTTPTNYAWSDPTPASFYRIAEFDIDGSSIYSTIASASCTLTGVEPNVHPNPVRDMAWVTLNTPEPTQLKIEIYNAAGARTHGQITALHTGSNDIGIDMTPLPTGTYFLVLQWNNGHQTKTIKLEKLSP